LENQKIIDSKAWAGKGFGPVPRRVGCECWMDPKSSSRYESGEILLANDRVDERLCIEMAFSPIFDGFKVGENIP